MVKRTQKSKDGLYHSNKGSFENNIGSRAQVWHGTAKKTSGGLHKSDLLMNKQGRIVSAKKSKTAKKDKRLEKAGYKPVKGKFRLMSKSMKNKRK